ncbi:MAG TPA: DUF4287 domain-containing protein [Fimbriimonas sp.]|nr:DUF4287 domain-containing protein [Fimbriimonas sp.]
MPIRPEEALANMIDSLPAKTGKSLDEWRALISAKGIQKHGEIMAFLKGEHGISHGFANQIALRSKAEEPTHEDPIQAVFAKRPVAKEIYDALMARVQEFGDDVDVAPKKGYVSLRRSKQFAIMQPAADRLDVGINLKGVCSTERLEPSGSFNAMLSNRVRVKSAAEIDSELLSWLKQAYEQS